LLRIRQQSDDAWHAAPANSISPLNCLRETGYPENYALLDAVIILKFQEIEDFFSLDFIKAKCSIIGLSMVGKWNSDCRIMMMMMMAVIIMTQTQHLSNNNTLHSLISRR
jgi:hypothetical protein